MMKQPISARNSGQKKPFTKRWRRPSWIALGLVAVVIPAASWMLRSTRGKAAAQEVPVQGERVLAPSVEVIQPKRGGIQKTTTQPGSLHGFETVDLFAMVSGYLKTQSVDIGSRIKKGDVLAVIDAPREARAVDESRSLLEQSKAQTDQAEARIKSMQGEREAAAASVRQAESDVGRLVAARSLAEKQLARVTELANRRAVDQRLVDENQREMDAAVAGEQTARLAVLTAKARLVAADAKIDQARADAAEARAAVGVAQSRLATARVNLDYTRIIAPFDGVVTHRGFHPGAFIRSATDGVESPLLTVKRDDLMRIVVRVPDRDVVFTDVDDPATVKIDALGGQTFSGKVSRIGESEDPNTRTMHVEIDLPNPKRVGRPHGERALREGMYGTVNIILQATSSNMTVPTACVKEHSAKSRGVIFVVREGVVRRTEVELGADNGSLVEVLTNIKPDDAVILRAGVPLEDGMTVVASSAATADAR